MKARLVKFGEIEIEGKRYTQDVLIDGSARRKSIARSAALQLDCASPAQKTGTYQFTRSIFNVAGPLALAM